MAVAKLYAEGIIFEQDFNEAIRYYKMAADKGYSKTKHNLGLYYENGIGVEQDNEKSLHYLITAANLGWQPAIEILKENGIKPTNE